MSKVLTDGLSRLQTQSRIPAATWRQWCDLLKIEAEEAVDVWEEICYPIMIATRKVPEVTYILQLRAERIEPDIFEFKEEIAKVLHFFTFLYNLEDETLSRGKLKTALLKFYKYVTNDIPETHSPAVFIERFTVELCLLVLVAKILKGANITLSGVLKTVGEGRGTLAQVVRLASKNLLDEPYGRAVHEVFADPSVGILEPLPPREDEDEDAGFENYPEQVEEEFDAEADEGEESEGEEYEAEAVDGFGPDTEGFDEAEGRVMEDFLLGFKAALSSIYEFEAEVQRDEIGDDEAVDELLGGRLKVVERFEPFDSTIPSIEEAQNLARRAEVARNPARLRKSSGGISGAVLGGGSGGGPSAGDVKSAIIATQLQKRSETKSKTEEAGTASDSQEASGGGGSQTGQGDERIDMNEVEEVEVAAEDVVEAPEVRADEFSDKVREVARQLAAIDQADRNVWNLFLDPAVSVQDPIALARGLATEQSGPFLAYEAVRGVAAWIRLKGFLTQDGNLQNERNFSIKVNTFINQISNNNREILPDSRPLVPLKAILDNAGACLLRLESLRTNQRFSIEFPENYTRDAVTLYYEGALRAITDEVDRQVLANARKRADADTYALLEVFAAKHLVQQVVESCCEFAEALSRDGHAASLEDLREALQVAPIQLNADENEVTESPADEDLGLPGGIGEIYDEVCRHVCVAALSILEERHEPEKVLEQIRLGLRRALAAYLKFSSEKRRHMEMPQVGLPVVGLDKVSGNPALKDLFVRVGEDGGVMLVESYEDGSYADIFELREYQPMRMASNQQKKAATEGEEVLQTGHKYLYSVGRTANFFGATPSEIINGCVRRPDGGVRVFTEFK
jgi:hypothetical protein